MRVETDDGEPERSYHSDCRFGEKNIVRYSFEFLAL